MKRFNRRLEAKVRNKLTQLTAEYKDAETKLIAAIDYWVALPKEPPFVVQREHIIEAGDRLSDAADRLVRFFSTDVPDSYTPPNPELIPTSKVFAEGGKGSERPPEAEWLNPALYDHAYFEWEKMQKKDTHTDDRVQD